MFSRSSKYAAHSVRTYIAPLRGGRRPERLPTFRSTFTSSSSEGDSSVDLQDKSESSPNSKPIDTKFQNEDRRHRLPQRTLDVDALGQPGKILVLPLTERRQPKIVHKDEDESGDTYVENKSTLPVDSFIKDRTEGNDSDYTILLNEIRSSRSSGDIISSEEWMELQATLERSFTLKQLSNYVSNFSHDPSPPLSINYESNVNTDANVSIDDTGNEDETWQEGNYFEMTSGESDTTSILASQAPKSGGNNKKTKMTKDVLAARILRDCWQLEVQDAMGKLDIRLPSQVISMLISSDQYSLEELAHSHSTKIEPFVSLNLIRVYGTRRACESVREIVKSYCSDIRTEKINLKFLDKLNTGDDDLTKKNFLEWITKTYGVYLQDLDRNSTASVSYFAGNENMFNRAQQELEIAGSVQNTKPVLFSSYVPSDSTGLLKAISLKRSEVLSLLNKSKSWTRWTMPTSLEDYKDSLPPLFSKHKPTFSSEILQVLREGTSHAHRNDVEERLTASIGQCLFQRSIEDKATSLNAAQLGELGMSRLWHGWLPKMVSFIGTLQRFPGTEGNSRNHRFRMFPCNQNDRNLPILEVDLKISWKRNRAGSASLEQVELKSVKAVVEETRIDYLLPETNYDLRFTRTLTCEIFKVPENDYSGVLQETLLYSLSEPLNHRGKPFPPTCQVPLLTSLLREIIPSEAKNNSDPGEVEAKTVVGHYWFPSLRSFQGTMFQSFDWLGERLNYNHISGGSLGTRKDDNVNLEMLVLKTPLSPPSRSDIVTDGKSNSIDATLEQEFRSFYQTACQLAISLSKHSSRGQT